MTLQQHLFAANRQRRAEQLASATGMDPMAAYYKTLAREQISKRKFPSGFAK